MSHPLHRVVGDTICEADLLGYTVLRDAACGISRHVGS